MEESILNSIKELLGPDSDYSVFDNEILIHINMALSVLTQHGVGPKGGITVTDDSTTWADFLGNESDLGMAKTYVYMKVKMAFDPPGNSFLLTNMEEACREFEWRLMVAMDDKKD